MFDILNAGTAWAMGAGGGAGGGEAGGLGGLLGGPLPMLIIMFAIFYFLLIRPQQKRNKQHRELLGNLKKGDQVMTSGGIFGRITGINDQTVVLEIAPEVRIKISRASVGGLATGGTPPPVKK
jgi:preprotein translocase subunit YajC